MKRSIIKNYILPFSSKLTHHKAWDYYKKFIKSDFISPAKREEKQWIKIKNIINHAYKNVPFYRKKFNKANLSPKDIETKEDLLKVPITTKGELRKNFPDNLIAKNYKGSGIRFSNTSGTINRPTMLAYDINNVNYQYAAKLRSRNLYGGDIGDSVMRITPNICQPVRGCGETFNGLLDFIKEGFTNLNNSISAFLEKIVIDGGFNNKMVLPPMGKNKTNIKNNEFLYYINKIKEHKPKIIVGYPLYLFWLARFIERNNIKLPKIDIIDLTGGLSTEKIKNYIEDVLGTEVYECYGGCGFGRIAASCGNLKLMHILEELCYIEFIRPDGKPSEEGKLGNLIITSLTNYAMPLIRVEHEDVGWYTDDHCKCGRTSRLINVEGRIQSLIMDGNKGVHKPKDIYDTLIDFPGVEYFQVVQKDMKSIELRIVKNNTQSLNKNKLKKNVEDLFPADTSIDVKELNYIRSESSNKYMLVKSSTFNNFRPKSIRDKESEIN